ncbi:alginate O-acetyltransferase AlgI [Legionella steelei]|uniref:Probable alginate O-acetylase n=1 Tax=Legionella steelei TaxID=947033 RepID=A0A0W0ZJG1_9GAMM|nr:MBOAT family O-acyltransferase [Legionella steelei]KTD69423.1 alginate O-acetyltransferase AlgI [Legionella steelei]
MGITTFRFFCFLGIASILYYLVRPRQQWKILLLANIVFYIGSGQNKLNWFILFTSLSVYFGAMAIEGTKHKSLAFYSTLALNLGFLIYFKYFNFFIQELINPFLNTHHLWYNILMPVGISFYTLQTLGYLIDIKREMYPAERNYGRFFLFATFFPTVLQGPIHKHQDLQSQLFAHHQFDWQRYCFGMQRILWGLFKKLVIADRLALFVNPVFADPQYNVGWIMVLAIVAFAIQLYADFSGCMDIVIGAGEMFGIKMTENFRAPFFSRSIQEYWQRWHITLGIWLKEYILYSVMKSNWLQKLTSWNKERFGKKAGNKISTYIALFILWFVVGFWHGASWNFIIGTGLLHWFYITFGDVAMPWRKKAVEKLKINTEAFSFKAMQIVRTFIFVCIGFVFFRTKTLADAGNVFKSITFDNNFWIFFDGELLEFMNKQDWTLVICATIVLFTADTMRLKVSLREKIAELDIVSRWFIYFTALFSVVIFGMYGPGYDVKKFIYGAF